MTQGIRISCKCKRLLYLCTRNSNDISLKKYYKQYCKILTKVIKEAKKYTYNNQINKSTNKGKTTWNIIKKETNRHKRSTTMTDYQNSPEAFNNYFLTVSENIIKISGPMNKTMTRTTILITIYQINFTEPFLT